MAKKVHRYLRIDSDQESESKIAKRKLTYDIYKFHCVRRASFREACQIRSLVHGVSGIIPKFPHYYPPQQKRQHNRVCRGQADGLSDPLGTITMIFFECIYALSQVQQI